VALEAILLADSRHPLAPKLMRGLFAHRVGGRWATTQENAFVVCAAGEYFRRAEAVAPDFTASAWLGAASCGSARFQGRSADRHHAHLPMADVVAQCAAAAGAEGGEGDGTSAVTIRKEGVGRLYYRCQLSYVPKSLQLEASSGGFSVERTYTAVGDPADVTVGVTVGAEPPRDVTVGAEPPGRRGAWRPPVVRVRAGALVRVHITLSTPIRRYHVALVDKLPAGLEALNSELAGTPTFPGAEQEAGGGRGCWWRPPRWYEHESLRDERVEAFTSLLTPGVWTFSYVARATTHGIFVAPPATACEMYSPDAAGRSDSATVHVLGAGGM